MTCIYVARSSSVAARRLGEEMVIMSAADSTLFSLNETATLIWEAADGQTQLSEIVERRICQEFDVEPEQAYRDAVELTEELSRRGILVLSSEPIADGLLGSAGTK